MAKPDRPKPLVLGAALGNCVHVAGLLSFLELAEREGYRTRSLGCAVSVEALVEAIRRDQPELVAVSYRLTPEVGRNLLEDLVRRVREAGLADRRFVFGGTQPVADLARELDFFEAVFGSDASRESVLACLRNREEVVRPRNTADNLRDRLAANQGYPLLRHHFGQPTVAATVEGAAQIAEAAVLDVLSLGPDQNAQEFLFRPDQMRHELDGAGGVPIRSAADLEAIYQATRRGNYPLLRIYAGTQDLLQWAELSVATLHNAWGAIPLFWYNRLDGRSPRPLVESIRENQATMRWYAERGIPVECNEAHHWSLREAPDAVAVAAAFLGAYNAKAVGVATYVAQYMFNTPPRTWPKMDLAKMLAQRSLVESLHDEHFVSVTETRAGLGCFHADPDLAKGQLAASTVLQTALEPQIVHVVGYSEGHHAITAPELIESCRIVHGALAQCREGMPDPTRDPAVTFRRDELLTEAELILAAIRDLGGEATDPYCDPQVLAQAVRVGILDAPHLAGREEAWGRVVTTVAGGAVRAAHPETRQPIGEHCRLAHLETPIH